ncbi:MAG: response regulator [Myxococcales bacterium]|nr:response regulator [Myxococcales bacterium]
MVAGAILIVEDHEDSREMLADLLGCHGYAVVTAENGLAALEALRGGLRPSLVLLDLTMPVMDGWQLFGEIRRHGELSAVPVVVLTAMGTSALPEGCQGYLRKPVELDELMVLVRRHCGEGPS